MSALPPKADMCSAPGYAALGQKRTLRLAGNFSASYQLSGTRQNDPDLGELAGLCINLNCARMLLDDDVVADREAKAGALAGRLGGEKRVEHLFFHVRRNTGAVIANPDFHPVAKVLG